MTQSRVLKAAKLYASFGWRIFPTHADKKPAIMDWDEAATNDVKQIEAWWGKNGSHSEKGIGIATGPDSNLVVLDVDTRHEGDISLEILTRGHKLPETLHVQTPSGGSHYYFTFPEVDVRNSAGKLGRGLDIRGTGGFVVAPPSISKDGTTYEFTNPKADVAELPEWLLALIHEEKKKPPVELVKPGSRNNDATRVAGQLRRDGMDESQIFAMLKASGTTLDDGEISTIAASVARYPSERSYARTDSGQAELVAALFGDKITFDSSTGRWRHWTGQSWRIDTGATVYRYVLDAARARQQHAIDSSDPDAKDEIKFALNCENRYKIDDVIKVLERKLEGPEPDGWDKNPMLLGTPTGIVDLKTGTMVEAAREQFISKTTRVSYDPEAACPRWEQFMLEVFEGDAEMVDWMQRALGYTITGLTKEHLWFIAYGDGANGKTTLFDTVLYVLGDYSRVASTATIMEGRQTDGSSASPDVARLAGSRLVTCNEISNTASINHQRIKDLTGGSKLLARHLNRAPFEFLPTFKLWVSTNAKPTVSDNSFGFWRRVKGIPFNFRFTYDSTPKRDDDLPDYLISKEGPGILNWLVKGAQKYDEQRLRPFPRKVEIFTSEFQRENDISGTFIQEQCEEIPDAKVGGTELYAGFRRWEHSRGTQDRYILSMKRFKNDMAKRFKVVDGNYVGVRLKRGDRANGI